MCTTGGAAAQSGSVDSKANYYLNELSNSASVAYSDEILDSLKLVWLSKC